MVKKRISKKDEKKKVLKRNKTKEKKISGRLVKKEKKISGKPVKKRSQKKEKRIKPEKFSFSEKFFQKPESKEKKEELTEAKKKIFENELVHKTKIRVIGIGGGGGAIVSEIAERIKKADFYIANTDSRALKESTKKVKKFQFGRNLTKGLGTGMNVLLAETAAAEEKENIKKILEGQDICVIIACLGGGTSSGATPLFAKISQSLNNLTYGIFTLPFKFEGEKKMEIALEALNKIKPYLNIYTVIPNEKIFEIVDKETPLKTALSAINEKLANNLEALIEMIYLPGLINIDFADLKTILSGRGKLSYLNSVEIEPEEKEKKEEIINKLIYSSLYPYSSKSAKSILYNIVGGKEIKLSEVAQISNIILDSVNRQGKIIFGINQNQKYREKIRVTLLAVGCSGKEFLRKNKKKRFLPEIKSPRIFKSVFPEKSVKIEKISEKKFNKSKKKKAMEEKSAAEEIKIQSKKKIFKKNKISRPKISPKKSLKPIPWEIKKTSSQVSEKKPNRILVENLDNKKIRKNALQIKEEIEETEKKLLEEEKVWEIPAIFRKKM